MNGKGHIWKATFAPPEQAEATVKPTEAMEHAAELRKSDNVAKLVESLDSNDPAMAQAAQYGLSRLAQAEKIQWNSLTSAQQRIGVLAALLWRGTSVQPFIAEALKDSDDRVRQMAIRAITEQNIKAAREDLNASLGSQSMSPRLLGMTIAAINFLDGDRGARIDSGKINAVLLCAPRTARSLQM